MGHHCTGGLLGGSFVLDRSIVEGGRGRGLFIPLKHYSIIAEVVEWVRTRIPYSENSIKEQE